MKLEETVKLKGEIKRPCQDSPMRWQGGILHCEPASLTWVPCYISTDDLLADDWYEIGRKPEKLAEQYELRERISPTSRILYYQSPNGSRHQVPECEADTHFAGWLYRREGKSDLVNAHSLLWVCPNGCNAWENERETCGQCDAVLVMRRPDAARMRK